MQSGQDRNGDNSARSLDCSMQGHIFLSCQVRARLIVIRRIGSKNLPQVRLSKDQHSVLSFPKIISAHICGESLCVQGPPSPERDFHR